MSQVIEGFNIIRQFIPDTPAGNRAHRLLRYALLWKGE